MDIWAWVLIIAVAVLAIFVIGCVVAVYVILHKLSGGIQSAIADIKAGAVVSWPPYRLRLKPMQGVQWRQPEQAEAAVAALIGCGFQHDGDYANRALNTRLSGFVHPDQRLLACVTEVGDGNPDTAPPRLAIDLFCEHAHGSITVTSTPDQGMTQPPYERTIRMPDATVPELYERVLAERVPDANPVAPGDFAKTFCEAYARQMDWRVQQGGYPRDEVIRMINAGTEPLPDDPEEAEMAIDIIDREMNGALCEGFDRAMATRFRKQQNVAREDWVRMEHNILLVHRLTPAETLVGHVMSLSNQMCHDDEKAYEARHKELAELFTQARAAGSQCETFAQLIPQLPRHECIEKMGELEAPVHVDVYRLDERLNDWR